MSKKSNDQGAHTFSRRQFLESIGAAGALGIIGPSLMSFGAMAAETNSGDVLTGSHWGAFRATVKNGRMTAVRGWEKDPFPSPQLKGVMDSVYSPTRIKYPMVRRAYLEGGPGASPETRGKDDFVRVSWDQALDLVAKEVKRVQQKYGPLGIFGGSYGWFSPGALHNSRTLARRFLNGSGGFVSHVGDYSTGSSQVIMPHVMGSLEVYEQQTAWPVVVDNTEIFVVWGADPMVTNQIGWVIPDHGGYEGMAAFKKTGKRVICIDPVRTKTCDYFKAEWIAPKPQTDVALMLGIAHTLHTEGLADKEFLAKYTTGFDKFLPYLTGEKDGQPKDAKWASSICGIDAKVIRQLARDFKAKRTMLSSGWSMQRQHHGEQAHWMLVTLACMLGQIGLPGGGFGLSYHYSSGGSPSAKGPKITGIGDGGKQIERGTASPQSQAAALIPVARIVDMLQNPGGEFDFNGKKQKYPDVKLLYWAGGNPFVHHQDRNRMRKAWQKVETFIVHDFQWTPTARHADIILPCTTSYERNDLAMYGDYSLKAIVAMRKVVEPMYESRSDFDIFVALSERIGSRKFFDEGKDEMAWLKGIYKDCFDKGAALGVKMPEFDAFWKQGYVEFPVSDEGKKFVRHAKFRADPLLNPLGTPSGRIEIFSRNIEKMGYDDCPPHPTWMEPVERLDGPNAKFPLHITSSHSDGRLHSQLCGTVMRDTYAVGGREPCLINTEDAKKRGIKDGDVVRVFNDRGQILAGAKVTNAIRPGVIRVCEGGWFDPVDPSKPGSLCRYGDVNVLTVDMGTSKLAQGNCGHTAIGDVEKYKGDAPKPQVFVAPKEGS